MPFADLADVRLYYPPAARSRSSPTTSGSPSERAFQQIEVREQVNAMIERFLALSL